MDNKSLSEHSENEPTLPTRRQFVKTSAQVAVTAPAVAVLLSATTKQAFAATDPDSYALGGHATGSGDVGTARDDPNHNEDIDYCHNLGGQTDDHPGTCPPGTLGYNENHPS